MNTVHENYMPQNMSYVRITFSIHISSFSFIKFVYIYTDDEYDSVAIRGPVHTYGCNGFMSLVHNTLCKCDMYKISSNGIGRPCDENKLLSKP